MKSTVSRAQTVLDLRFDCSDNTAVRFRKEHTTTTAATASTATTTAAAATWLHLERMQEVNVRAKQS